MKKIYNGTLRWIILKKNHRVDERENKRVCAYNQRIYTTQGYMLIIFIINARKEYVLMIPAIKTT